MKSFPRRELLFYLSFFAFLVLLACFFTPAPDDRLWATSYGQALFERGYANYNGRYLGNLSAYFFLRIPWILPIVKALVLTGVLWLTQRITGNRDMRFLCLCAVLLLLPGPLFIQDFAWTTAFLNYEVPVLLLLCLVYLVFCAQKRACWLVAIAALGFAAQLFMEHYTLFALAFSAYAVVRRKYRRFLPRTLTWFFSAVAGAVLMFSNGNYLRVLRRERGYQRVSLNFVGGLLRVMGSFAAACLPILLTIAVLLILLRRRTPGVFAKLPRSLAVWRCAAILVVLNAPLILVYPMGPRCFSLSAALLLLMTHKLFIAVAGAGGADDSVVPPRGMRALATVLALTMALDLAGYLAVGAANRAKVAQVRAQVAQGNHSVVLRHTPMRFLVNALDQEPINPNILRGFLEYYELPEDVTISYQ
ncbi:MAG: hypothetical protein LBG83_09560 [Oscillospiraceae bacterium]|jgi:hypothetical protein|nr:hypothetical protein [Oscillospiraceae bacterium]